MKNLIITLSLLLAVTYANTTPSSETLDIGGGSIIMVDTVMRVDTGDSEVKVLGIRVRNMITRETQQHAGCKESLCEYDLGLASGRYLVAVRTTEGLIVRPIKVA